MHKEQNSSFSEVKPTSSFLVGFDLILVDVMKNKDVIFREVSEGVNCMTFG